MRATAIKKSLIKLTIIFSVILPVLVYFAKFRKKFFNNSCESLYKQSFCL